MVNSQAILRALQAGKISSEEAKSQLTNPKSGEHREAIAIIGMSGRYPEADNLDAYWSNLKAGRDSIREIPPSRWDVASFYQPFPSDEGKIYSKWLGLMDDVACFDPLFFNIAPSEAETMDPQQRLFLQEGYQAFADAGYTPEALNGQNCGVYLGIMANEYYRMLCEQQYGLTDMTGNYASIASARIAYFLNLKGPALSIDTACSSSLVAINLACEALLNRKIDMALAGGVTLYLTPKPYIEMCAAHMLSPEGRCKAFDKSSDGMVPGEGVGAVVLKRLQDAEADNDLIYGVIIGFGINQDGKTNGLTAPSVKSQIALERSIYQNYNIDPSSISYAEMHGTGTQLGDPIELKALSTAFQEKTDKKQFCAIGSVKSNIGHTSAAAGVASVHKVLLSMQHQQLVPTLHFKEPNEYFDFKNSPFYVNTQTRPWDANSPRRACVSSFGFSGTNAHLVIEAYETKKKRVRMPVTDASRPALFVLSAKTEKQLKVYAGIMKEWIESQVDVNLKDMTYTLQTSREAMDYRMAFWMDSKFAAIDMLTAYLNDEQPDGLHISHVKKRKGQRNTSLHTDPETLFSQWLAGEWVDWQVFYKDDEPRHIRLPGYPFAKEHYWLPKQDTTSSSNSTLHPLVHLNTSDLSTQRFTTILTGKEAYLTDHQVKERRVLPGSAYLEMARTALEQGVDRVTTDTLQQGTVFICLQEHIWIAPLVVEDKPVEVHITLALIENGNVEYEIYSGSDHPDDQSAILHAQGVLKVSELTPPKRQSLQQLKSQYPWRTLLPENIYPLFREAGLYYGPSHSGIERLYLHKDQILAKISVLPESRGDRECYLDPGLLDAVFQATAGFAISLNAPLDSLPFTLKEMYIYQPCPKQVWAYIRQREKGRVFDIDVYDENGMVCVRILGFETRRGAGLMSEEAFYRHLSERIWNGELSQEEVERILMASR
ncbi:type I polyketide synthase [Bacillus inaquosorum]|nr:type I polyketide synthase [Bacillus inaquosorum]